jgi:dTDP-glucose 4,6-dehydratase
LDVLNVLVTGGAGFIGSEFVRHLLKVKEYRVYVIDSLRYAGSLLNLADVQSEIEFKQLDIRNRNELEELFIEHNFSIVINFAAETHVDNSITGPKIFFESNIIGTENLLELCLEHTIDIFFQISTDEVYGSVKDGFQIESNELNPSSPYAASKASADLVVRAFAHTYKLKTLIARCSNNYGPRQFPEKFIPTAIRHLLAGEKVPIYGNGSNVREWVYVTDTCEALIAILTHGIPGSIYNISSGNFKTNLEVFSDLCRIMRTSEDQFQLVKDRAGHDYRYALDSSKIRGELSWQPHEDFLSGLEKTVNWYTKNQNRFLNW